MGVTTANYSLYKPSQGEVGYDDEVNGNFDTIDTALKGLQDAIDAVEADIVTLEGGVSSWKTPVVAASTANVTLDTAVEAGDSLDGVTLAEGDRILLKDQTTGTENGIYVVVASGAPSRATDFDSATDALGAMIPVVGGTVNAGTVCQVTNTAITWGTTALTIYTAVMCATKLVAGTTDYYCHPGMTGTICNPSTSSTVVICTWMGTSAAYASMTGKILFLVPGTVSVKFDLAGTGTTLAYARIYKNGSTAIGTERSASTTATPVFSTQAAETFTVAAGDYIEIKGKFASYSYPLVRNFAIGLSSPQMLRHVAFI